MGKKEIMTLMENYLVNLNIQMEKKYIKKIKRRNIYENLIK